MGSDDDRHPRPGGTPGGDASGEAGSTAESGQHGYGRPEGYRDAPSSGGAQGQGAPEGLEDPWYARPGSPGTYGHSGAPDPYWPPAPGWVPVYPLVRPTNALAIASLVLGIIWLYWVGSVLALVFGYVAKRQILERGEQGGGLATAGIALGWIGIGTMAMAALLWVVMLRPAGSW